MTPCPIGGGIKQRCCLTSDDVCRVHREYSWRPQLTESKARWGPQARRKACMGWSWAAAYRGGAYRGGLPPTACCCYHRQGGHVFIGVCLFVCL